MLALELLPRELSTICTFETEPYEQESKSGPLEIIPLFWSTVGFAHIGNNRKSLFIEALKVFQIFTSSMRKDW